MDTANQSLNDFYYLRDKLKNKGRATHKKTKSNLEKEKISLLFSSFHKKPLTTSKQAYTPSLF